MTPNRNGKTYSCLCIAHIGRQKLRFYACITALLTTLFNSMPSINWMRERDESFRLNALLTMFTFSKRNVHRIGFSSASFEQVSLKYLFTSFFCLFFACFLFLSCLFPLFRLFSDSFLSFFCGFYLPLCMQQYNFIVINCCKSNPDMHLWMRLECTLRPHSNCSKYIYTFFSMSQSKLSVFFVDAVILQVQTFFCSKNTSGFCHRCLFSF